MTACTRAKPPPATAAQTRPNSHELNLSAPSAPKKAPESIIPSRPMLTTPLRSQNIPPIAAKVSGVAQTSVDDSSADQTTTWSRLPTLARVESSPSTMPTRPAPIALQPGRLTSRVTAQIPAAIAQRPTSTGHHGLRALTGGIVSQKAKRPSTIPPIATCRAVGSRGGCAGTAFTRSLSPP